MKIRLEEVVNNQDSATHDTVAEIKCNNPSIYYNIFIGGKYYMENQEIHNSGNFINSIGNRNNNTLEVEDNSVYKSAIKEITEHIRGNEQEDAKDIIESIENAMRREKPTLAQRLFDSLPQAAKALPAVIKIGTTIAALF